MAAEDQDSRTEDPTSKRQEEAWGKGDIATSREVSLALSMLVTLLIFLYVLPWSARPLFAFMRSLIERLGDVPMGSAPEIMHLGARLASLILLAILPVMLAFAVSGILAVYGQHRRFIWAPEKLKPRWSVLNPASGFGRIFGSRALIEYGKNLVKFLVIAGAGWLALGSDFSHVEALIGSPPQRLMPLMLAEARKLLLFVFAAMLVIALADMIYQRWQHWRQLKMTKQEVKDEAKNADGDPTIKSKQRARRQQRARNRMLKSVPTASVVITNPTHFAVALKYERGMNAPKLVAKGVDHMAKRIRDLAREADVPIVENPPVARALYATVEIEQDIRPEHYKAVAEIVGYVMRLRRRAA